MLPPSLVRSGSTPKTKTRRYSSQFGVAFVFLTNSYCCLSNQLPNICVWCWPTKQLLISHMAKITELWNLTPEIVLEY